MNRDMLKQVVTDQQPILLPDHYVPRGAFTEVQALQKSKQIIILVGIRRCGKSTLLQYLRKHSQESDYYINFDDDRLALFELEDFQVLFELFIELYGIQKTFFFDEIQNIPGWERFVRRLHDQGYQIYITGSNATLFSKELGSRLTGRHIQIEMYPFSFREYVSDVNSALLKIKQFTSIHKSQIKKLFSQYTTLGGIPDYVHFQNTEYLHSLYESILYRDLITRYKLPDERAIKELVYYLASQAGKEVSYNALSKTVGLASANTVSNYCGYLQNSFLCFFVSRFSSSLKKQIHYAKKVYFIDTALAKAVGFRMSEDNGRMLENIVFLELKRRKKEIYFHKENRECDFVLRKGPVIEAAIQVCAELNSNETKQREIAGLLEAMELYQLKKGYILTNDLQHSETIHENGKSYTIYTIPVWQWLLSSDFS